MHRYAGRAGACCDHASHQVLESFVARMRDNGAAPTFIKKTLTRHGRPEAITSSVRR
jgi:transposase-like protein